MGVLEKIKNMYIIKYTKWIHLNYIFYLFLLVKLNISFRNRNGVGLLHWLHNQILYVEPSLIPLVLNVNGVDSFSRLPFMFDVGHQVVSCGLLLRGGIVFQVQIFDWEIYNRPIFLGEPVIFRKALDMQDEEAR